MTMMVERGATVTVVGRSMPKWIRAEGELRRAHPRCDVEFLQHDLSLVREAHKLAIEMRRHKCIDAIVHCAGEVFRHRRVTDEGLENVFAVQYINRHYLSEVLLEQLRASKNPRVIVVSAGGTINMELDFENLQVRTEA